MAFGVAVGTDGPTLMMNLIKRFITDESGSTAIEYALIAAGIVLAAYTSMQVVGALTAGLFGKAVLNLTPAVQ